VCFYNSEDREAWEGPQVDGSHLELLNILTDLKQTILQPE